MKTVETIRKYFAGERIPAVIPVNVGMADKEVLASQAGP
jgi:hypothetical protein